MQLSKGPNYSPYIESAVFQEDTGYTGVQRFYVLDLFNFEMLIKQYYNTPVIPCNLQQFANNFGILTGTLRRLSEMDYKVWLANLKVDGQAIMLTRKSGLNKTYEIARSTMLPPSIAVFGY